MRPRAEDEEPPGTSDYGARFISGGKIISRRYEKYRGLRRLELRRRDRGGKEEINLAEFLEQADRDMGGAADRERIEILAETNPDAAMGEERKLRAEKKKPSSFGEEPQEGPNFPQEDD